MSRISHAPLRAATICAVWLSVGNLTWADQITDDVAPLKKPSRVPQTAATAQSESDRRDPPDDEDRPASTNPTRPSIQTAARPKPATRRRGETQGHVAVVRAQNAGSAAGDDSANSDPGPASVRSQAATASNRSRNSRLAKRRTAIDPADVERAEAATPQPRGSRATYVQTEFAVKDSDEDYSDATAVPPGLSPRDEEPPSATGPSLEEQVAELKARLDSLSEAPSHGAPSHGAPSHRAPSHEAAGGPERSFDNDVTIFPTANQSTGGNVSTVQGSVFGPDNAAAGTFAVDNLTFVSKDGNFKMHVGGVVQLDAIGFANTPPAIGIPGGAGINESVEFRRLRVRAEGTMYENIDYVMEIDMALALQNTDQLNGGAPITGLRSFPLGVGVQGGNTTNAIQPTTVFMTIKDVPILGNVRVGSQQDWFSLEHIESARFLDFMERSTIMDAFSGPNNNGYTPGISAFNNTADKRAGAQIGVYKNNVYDSGFTYSIGDAWTYGGRVIWTPYYDEESKGRYLLHTGIGSEWRSFNTGLTATQGFDNVRIRSRGLLRNAASTLDPNYADSGNFYAVSQTLIDPELAFQWGPALLQAEYTASWFNGARAAQNLPGSNLGTVFMSGGYAEGLYFLTGENRDYNRQSGVFGRVVPNCNFNRAKGQWGAWQVGARYSWLNCNSGGNVNGGQEQDMTLALNWFLNPSARFQFNYVCSWINNAVATTFPGSFGALNGARFTGEGPINSFGARLDFNF